MRWFALTLLVILVLLQAKWWLGDGGVRDARKLEQAVQSQRDDNGRLQERNDALVAEVEDLKQGREAVEERARSDLGMVREDETFYQVIEEDPGAETEVDADVPDESDSGG